MRGSRKFCQRGSNLDNVFLVWWGRNYPNTTISGPSSATSKPHFKWRFTGIPIMAKNWKLAWSLYDFKGIRTSIAKKKLYFCDFWGGSGPPVPPLDLTMHYILLANVLLVFQCPGICLTPSQVDILVSDDFLAFCPTMYNRVFTWVETRAKSEFRVKHVECWNFFT